MSATATTRARTPQTATPKKNPAPIVGKQNAALRGPVVLATRGTSDSPSAFSISQLLATKLNRKLSILSVVEPMVNYGVPPELQPGTYALDESERTRREADIKGQFVRGMDPAVSWSAEVRLGQPATEVCDVARTLDATFVVVGASPHRRMRRIVAGQRAAQILHRSAAPVISVAPWLKSLPKNVVAATDFSVASARAAEAALLIMEKGSTLTLVHVIPTNALFPMPVANVHPMRVKIQEALRKFAAALKDQAAAGITINTAVFDGDAATEVLDFAEKLGADMIAVGTHGGTTLRRALVGSVATEIFHSALCSVLASPPPPFAEQLRLNLDLRGTATTADATQFGAVLNEFSSRNAGKRVSLEEDDSTLGAQIQVHGYQLGGITFDKASHRVEVMLHARDARDEHLTRAIAGVTSVAIADGPAGEETALQIRHGKSQTLVLIDAATSK